MSNDILCTIWLPVCPCIYNKTRLQGAIRWEDILWNRGRFFSMVVSYLPHVKEPVIKGHLSCRDTLTGILRVPWRQVLLLYKFFVIFCDPFFFNFFFSLWHVTRTPRYGPRTCDQNPPLWSSYMWPDPPIMVLVHVTRTPRYGPRTCDQNPPLWSSYMWPDQNPPLWSSYMWPEPPVMVLVHVTRTPCYGPRTCD